MLAHASTSVPSDCHPGKGEDAMTTRGRMAQIGQLGWLIRSLARETGVWVSGRGVGLGCAFPSRLSARGVPAPRDAVELRRLLIRRVIPERRHLDQPHCPRWCLHWLLIKRL